MIELTTESTDQTIMWTFSGDKQKYRARLGICKRPFCACTEMEFKITDGSKTVAAVTYDTEKDTVVPKQSDSESDLLSKRMTEEFSDSDKAILKELFRVQKRMIFDTIDVNTIDPPAFPVDEIEATALMVDYNEIFPWSDPLEIHIGNTSYLIFDQYCIGSTCTCNDSMLLFFEVRPPSGVPDDKPVAISLDLVSGQWRIRELGKQPHEGRELMEHTKSEIPDLSQKLFERRRRLRVLYKRYRQKRQSELKDLAATQNPPASRNSLCPCGSGKKFKRCCGAK